MAYTRPVGNAANFVVTGAAYARPLGDAASFGGATSFYGSIGATLALSAEIVGIVQVAGYFDGRIDLAPDFRAQAPNFGTINADLQLTGDLLGWGQTYGFVDSDLALDASFVAWSNYTGAIDADYVLRPAFVAAFTPVEYTATISADLSLSAFFMAGKFDGNLSAPLVLTGQFLVGQGVIGSFASAISLGGHLVGQRGATGTIAATLPLTGSFSAKRGNSAELLADLRFAGMFSGATKSIYAATISGALDIAGGFVASTDETIPDAYFAVVRRQESAYVIQ